MSETRELSDDAKAVLGSWFGMMNVDGDLHFAMQKVRPTDRAKAALDELVSAGWLGYSPAQGGGHTYILMRSASRWMRWLQARAKKGDQSVNFKLVEPLPTPPHGGEG
jgi:hypothetical protein